MNEVQQFIFRFITTIVIVGVNRLRQQSHAGDQYWRQHVWKSGESHPMTRRACAAPTARVPLIEEVPARSRRQYVPKEGFRRVKWQPGDSQVLHTESGFDPHSSSHTVIYGLRVHRSVAAIQFIPLPCGSIPNPGLCHQTPMLTTPVKGGVPRQEL